MIRSGYACMQWPDRKQADRRETAGAGKVFGFWQEGIKDKHFSPGQPAYDCHNGEDRQYLLDSNYMKINYDPIK